MKLEMPNSPFLDAVQTLKNIEKELEYVLERSTEESPALVFKRVEEVKTSVERAIARLTPAHFFTDRTGMEE